MLNEGEFAEVRALYSQCVTATKDFREKQGIPVGNVDIEVLFRPVCEAYEHLTGQRETVANAVMHHRIALYGPPCKHCGHVLRTSRASKCFECGHEVGASDGAQTIQP